MSNEFITTDAAAIYQFVITSLEESVGEPLYPGDERRVFGEALVAIVVVIYNAMNDASRQKMLRYARGSVLDALGERAGVKRIARTPAHTMLRFTVAAPMSNNIIVPQGTRVTSDSVHYFATTSAAVIVAGQLYVDVEAESLEGGTEYNGIAIGAINTIVDLVGYVDGVENVTISNGGDDDESDDSFRERVRSAPSKLSTAGPINGYRYWAMSADSSIADVVVKSEQETLKRTLQVHARKAFMGGDLLLAETLVVYKADGSSAAYDTDYTAEYGDALLEISIVEGGALASVSEINISIEATSAGVVRIIPICEGGAIPSEDILQKVYDSCNASEVRPLTDKVIVEAPSVQTYDIELTYYTTAADESGCIQKIEAEGGAIDKYIEWQCAELGRAINPDKLRAMILAPSGDDAVGASRVTIISPDFTELNDTTIAKFSGTKIIKHKVTDR